MVRINDDHGPMGGTEYPDHFTEFLAFLCENTAWTEAGYLSSTVQTASPHLKAPEQPPYYEGLLSFREKNRSNRISDHGFQALTRASPNLATRVRPPSQRI